MKGSALRMSVLFLTLAAGGAVGQVAPDVTEDGLVRVPSSRIGAVYRAPNVAFAQYRRIFLEPATVEFTHAAQRSRGMTHSEQERIRVELARLFREELISELVERGQFPLADSPAPDVLRISPAIDALEISAPAAGTQPGMRTYVRSAGAMTLRAELHDSASGALVGRVIDRERSREFRELALANQVTNADEARFAFANAARLVRQALNVARTEKPR